MSRLFLNDKTREFVIMVCRGESNQVCNEVDKGSNQVEDHNTGLRHSDTNLDTDHDTFVEDHDTKRVPLTNKKKDIVNFCSVPRTRRGILERAGVVYHTC